MIAVIADDFTGAAEIGGIGLKYGLKVIIETEVKEASESDLLIIATDTRSLRADEAALETERIVGKLLKLKPQLIYKKLDSVLRGNIGTELVSHMKITGDKRAIVVAGNPFFGRIIKKGMYTINQVPLAQTHFSGDPDFPVKSSAVVEILKGEGYNVVSKSVLDELPEEGIIIGDVANHDDMHRWLSKINRSTVIAGGSGFFDILLSKRFVKNPYPATGEIHTGKEALFVFGSTFPKTGETVRRLSRSGVNVKNMPEEIYGRKDYDPVIFEQWVTGVVECLNRNRIVIVSVNFDYSNEERLPLRIKSVIAELVKLVVLETELTDLFIEGGATTSEILRSLNISKLYPFRELDFGIIQMKAEGYNNLIITTKPGSYSWPKSVVFENIVNAG